MGNLSWLVGRPKNRRPVLPCRKTAFKRRDHAHGPGTCPLDHEMPRYRPAGTRMAGAVATAMRTESRGSAMKASFLWKKGNF